MARDGYETVIAPDGTPFERRIGEGQVGARGGSSGKWNTSVWTMERGWIPLTYRAGARPGEEGNGVDAVTVKLSDVVQQEVRWLWRPLLPAGKITILCGDPGQGKSFLTLALAARVSAGLEMPGGALADKPPVAQECAGDVVLLSAEDDAADTLKPRLLAMGGDPERVHVLEGMRDARGGSAEFVIGEHAAAMDRLLSRLERPRLVVIDPVSAFVGSADSYNNAQVRAMLKPLSDLAADHGVAVLLVTHLKKGEASKVLYRAMGSLAFTAAARVVLCLTRDPRESERRLVLPVKSNLGQDRVGFAFRIVEGRVEFEPEALSGTADEIIGGGNALNEQRAAQVDVNREKYAAALRGILKAGPVPVQEVGAALEKLGLSLRYIQKRGLRAGLGIDVRRVAGGWVWELAEVEGGGA
jgi:putative DNA primase/helicase